MSDPEKARHLLERAEESGGAGLLLEVARAAVADQIEGSIDAAGVRAVLTGAAREELDAEPTCLAFLGQLAGQRGDFADAIRWFDAARAVRPEMSVALLGTAQALIAKVGNGQSAVSVRDRTTAQTLAQQALDDLRTWSGPSENALAVLLTTHMMIGAFTTAVTLATPQSLGGGAYDREASFGPVAVVGAQAALALRDRARAAGFAELVQGTDAETVIRALVMDPELPVDQQAARWRAALAASEHPTHQRRALYQLAALGDLTAEDLRSPRVAPNIDPVQREILTARNDATQGRVQQAVHALRRHASTHPAASEMLVAVLAGAGRTDEALTECDNSITRFGADKIAHDKLNLLVASGRLTEAHALAEKLLAGPDLAPEQRLMLRQRLIDHSLRSNDWPAAEQQLREAYAAHPDHTEFAWGLVTAQANQGRLANAWSSFHDLAPPIQRPEQVPLWINLHARFGFTQADIEAALDFALRWPETAAAVFTVLLDVGGQQLPDGGAVLPELDPELLTRFQRELDEFIDGHATGPIRRIRLNADNLLAEIRAYLVPDAGRLDRAAALVRTGTLPLGAFAVATHRAYTRALIEQTCGLQYACTTDPDLFDRELSAAQHALDARVVVETSALLLATLLPDRWSTLRSAFAEVQLPRLALVDIDACWRDLVRAPGCSYSVGYDPTADVLVRHETTLAEHQWLRERAIALDSAARELVVADFAKNSQPSPPHAVWLASIELARQHNLPLWSDDIAIRSIAAGQGIPSFGTVALITVLVEAELIPDTLRQDACILARAGVVDLVLTAEEIFDLAAVEQWAPRASAVFFSRAASWANYSPALDALLPIIAEVSSHAPDGLLQWFHAACVGAGSGLPVDQALTRMRDLARVIATHINAD